MGVTGEGFAEVRKIVAALQRVDTTVLPRAVDAMRVSAEAEYKKEFSTRVGPFGDAWGPNTTGVRTGELYAAVMTPKSKYAITIKPPKYWSYFQAGAPGGKHPNHLLPFGPSSWDAPIENAIRKEIDSAFVGL